MNLTSMFVKQLHYSSLCYKFFYFNNFFLEINRSENLNSIQVFHPQDY